MMLALFLAEGIICSFIVFIIFKYGYRKHLALLFLFITMFVFMFFSPLYGYLTHFTTLFDNYLWDYYPEIVLNYLIAIVFFLLGYLLLKKRRVSYDLSFTSKENYIDAKFIRIGLLISLFAFIMWGVTSGKSLSNIFLLGFFGLSENATYTEGLKGNNYLLLMIETFIPLLALSLYSNMKKSELVLWITIVAIIFLSQGFRYRFILLLSAFLLIYLYNNKLSIRKILFLGMSISIFMYAIIEVSNYRSSIRNSVKSGYVSQDAKSSNRDIANIVFSSTRNYLAFGSLLKYMDNTDIPYGYGETMIGHIFIRMLPSSFFDKNIKPRPPAIEISAKSWGSREALTAGEAYGGVGGVYYEFGSVGVALFFLLIGMMTKWLDQRISTSNNKIKVVFYIVITISLFKIITRGYLPEFFFSFSFILLPFLYIRFFRPKLWRKKNV